MLTAIKKNKNQGKLIKKCKTGQTMRPKYQKLNKFTMLKERVH